MTYQTNCLADFLSKKIIEQLTILGITSLDEFCQLETISIFFLLKDSGYPATPWLLYQLDAARRQVNWRHISQKERKLLRNTLAANSPIQAPYPTKEEIEKFIDVARQLANKAETQDEVPIGAIVVKNDQIIGQGYNNTITQKSPFAHAEIIALQEAAKAIGNYRLIDCDLYVTLEPCIMCAGAISQARIKRLIFGTKEPKSGAAGSVINIFANHKLNAYTAVFGPVDSINCAAQLTNFFRQKRQYNRQKIQWYPEGS